MKPSPDDDPTSALHSARGPRSLDDGANKSRVEVTVQNLTGITLCSDIIESRLLKASVAFSGSANDMQVGSSMICPKTGLLIVESEPLFISQFKQNEPVEFMWQSTNQTPHLTVINVMTSAVKAPLQQANRDSTVVKMKDAAPTKSFDKSTSELSESPLSLVTTLQSARSTNTAFWSDAMPEILELTVRIGGDGGCMGVAFLVFFGHADDQGTCVMELPIKRIADINNGKAGSVFTDEARLRVQVTMVVPRRTAEAVDTLPPITECSTNTSTSTSDYRQQLPLSRKFLEAQLAPILQKIQKHEKDAMEQRRNQKRGMDVDAAPNNNDDGLQHPSTRAFCSLWEPLRAAVGACHGSNYFTRRDSGCDSSTIGTRDSWEL